MSVKKAFMTVIVMPTALTLKIVFCVCVRQDTLEMEHFVKVSHIFIYHFFNINYGCREGWWN